MATKQGTWSRERGYIWSMIGSAVGFANVLSFSALCYRNGGGAFLIPYIVAHLVIGIPLLFLEGLVGQKTKLPLVSAMGRHGGAYGRMLGWIAVLTCATIGGFYMVLTGFSIAYTYFTATGSISFDSAYFFKHTFLQDTGSISTFGGLAMGVFLSTLLVAVFAWSVLVRNIRSGVERICSIFLPILAIMVVLFSIAAIFLPGSIEGFKRYLVPNFSTLSNWTLWRDVFGQVFFSLSLGLGIVTGYSRHNPESFSIPRAMCKVALGDFLISFISGFAIFGCIGFMSHASDVPFNSIITSDSAFEIGFVIFPTILSQFSPLVSRIIGPLFFFCVFIAGVTGVFSIVESVAGNFEVEFRKSRRAAVSLSMLLVAALAFPFCMGNGQHLVGALAPMVMGNVMLLGGVGEILLFLVLTQAMSREAIWQLKSRKTLAFYSLKYLVLPILMASLAGALYQEARGTFDVASAVRWSWLAVVLAMSGLLATRKAQIAETKVAS